MLMDSKYAVRDELVARLRVDLVGPSSEHEVLTDTPFSTYVAGVLYPTTAATVLPENEVDEHDDGDEATFADPPVSLANARYPSSMGLTFAVDATTGGIQVRVQAARYEELPGDPDPTWRRAPLVFVKDVGVDVPEDGKEINLEHGLGLYYRVRRPDPDGVASVTLVLINRRKAARFEKDAQSYFQTSMDVTGAGEAVFRERRTGTLPVHDEDLE